MNQEEFQNRIAEAANRTWQAIGGDVLRAAEVDSIPRDEVVECVMDHISGYGQDAEVLERYQPLTYEEKVAVLTKAFPHEVYGF